MRLVYAAIVLAACAPRPAPVVAAPAPWVPAPSPEDAFVAAVVADVNAKSIGDCRIDYHGDGYGNGSGYIVFRGSDRHRPPRPPGPVAQVTFHATLRTERYRAWEELRTIRRKERAAFDACMREHSDDDRVFKGASMRAEACGLTLSYLPASHFEEQFSVVRAEGSGDRFAVSEDCKDALALWEARMTPYPSFDAN